MERNRLVLLALCSFGIGALAVPACAPDNNLPPPSNATGAGGSGASGSGTGGDIFVGSGPGAGTGGTPDVDAFCGAVEQDGISTPLGLFIAFDKSSSMFGTKWDSGKAGLSAFVADPASAGTSVALNFFPLKNESTCDAFLYKNPVVPFGELPGNADAIKSALAAESPNGLKTPIYPAVGGAILACADQLAQKPGTACAVLLVTDGAPLGPAPTCSGVNPEDPQVIADLAAKGFSMYGIRTFVIGLQGAPQDTANLIAKAGGTDSAILIGSVNVQVEFQNALKKARGKALPCDYELPTTMFDPGFVNVQLTSSQGMEDKLLQDNDCSSGQGWKYDNFGAPKKIILCPSTCDAVRNDFGASIQILLGCPTEVAK